MRGEAGRAGLHCLRTAHTRCLVTSSLFKRDRPLDDSLFGQLLPSTSSCPPRLHSGALPAQLSSGQSEATPRSHSTARSGLRSDEGVRPGWMVTTYRPPNCGSDLGAPAPISTGFPWPWASQQHPGDRCRGLRLPSRFSTEGFPPVPRHSSKGGVVIATAGRSHAAQESET